MQAKWRGQALKDDPVKVTNARGTVVFATAGPNSRTTQIFINTRPQGNAFLDNQGFSPIGRVIEGMDIVDRFYAGYGEGARKSCAITLACYQMDNFRNVSLTLCFCVLLQRRARVPIKPRFNCKAMPT